MKKEVSYKMASSDDPHSIIKATQESVLESLRNLFSDLSKNDFKAPGLTWEQIDYILAEFSKKEPKVF